MNTILHFFLSLKHILCNFCQIDIFFPNFSLFSYIRKGIRQWWSRNHARILKTKKNQTNQSGSLYPIWSDLLVNYQVFFYLCLCVFLCFPTLQCFTHMETSPIQVKDCHFRPMAIEQCVFFSFTDYDKGSNPDLEHAKWTLYHNGGLSIFFPQNSSSYQKLINKFVI